MTDTELTELERLARDATPGPWKVEYQSDDTMLIVGDPTYAGMGAKQKITEFYTRIAHVLKDAWNGYNGKHTGNNYDYIAAANPATVLELIAEIRRLRDEIKYDITDIDLKFMDCVNERENLRQEAIELAEKCARPDTWHSPCINCSEHIIKHGNYLARAFLSKWSESK